MNYSDCESYLTQEPEHQCVICYDETLDVEFCGTCQNPVCGDCFIQLMESPHFKCPMCRTSYTHKHVNTNQVLNKIQQYYNIIDQLDSGLYEIMIECDGTPNPDQSELMDSTFTLISTFQDKIGTIVANHLQVQEALNV